MPYYVKEVQVLTVQAYEWMDHVAAVERKNYSRCKSKSFRIELLVFIWSRCKTKHIINEQVDFFYSVFHMYMRS